MERSSFFFKNGNARRRDVTDYFKLVEDACAEFWGVDDCRNYIVVGHKRWVEDGTLQGFEEPDGYTPPHKTLVGTIKITISALDENFAEWDGKLVPDIGVLTSPP